MSLVYFDGCPNWQVADARLTEALRLSGLAKQPVEHVLVTSVEQAEGMHFVGSPTILIDGEDPFLDDEPRPVGLTCRVYRTDTEVGGSPSVAELVAVLTARV